MQIEQLARDRMRSNLELAEHLRCGRKVQTVRRAQRLERKAERRMVAAWRRAAELHNVIESVEY
jgi:hypothetical protein